MKYMCIVRGWRRKASEVHVYGGGGRQVKYMCIVRGWRRKASEVHVYCQGVEEEGK